MIDRVLSAIHSFFYALKEENNDVNVQNIEKMQYAVDGLLEAKENKIIINLYNTIEHAKRNLELNQYKK